MIALGNELKWRIITGIIIGICCAVLFVAPSIVLSLVFLNCLFFILTKEMVKLYDFHKLRSWFFALAYPIAPFAILIYLNQTTTLVPFIFAITFAHDVGAYFVGKCCGRHLLCPTISPKKTWEGFFGGFFLVLLALQLFDAFAPLHLSFSLFIAFSFVLTVAATAGDLFESWLKRKAGVKDSGNSLPGHGGLLDRFDSILAATVVVFFLRNYIIF